MIHKIEADDLPTAWAKAFIECYEAPYSCIMPMIVSSKLQTRTLGTMVSKIC